MKYSDIYKRVLSSFILLPVSLIIIINGNLLFKITLLILLFLSYFEWKKITKNNFQFVSGLFFLTLSFFTIYRTRTINSDENLIFFLIVFFICIATDLGGYTFGKVFKGPKLTKISPNKTIVGVFGGYFFSIFFIFFFILYLEFFNFYSDQKFNLRFFIFIFITSTISQIGDLVISYFKRLSNVKDTGSIIPGHGGLLDRIDGMIFAFPFSYFYYYYL
jgi:phosphatidate cytidylyltransferase